MESVDLKRCFLAVMGFGSCMLRGANLIGALFLNSDLTDCDLRSARIHGTAFLNCKIHGAQFEAIDCSSAVFEDTKPENVVKAMMGQERGQKKRPKINKCLYRGNRLVRHHRINIESNQTPLMKSDK